MRRDVLLDTIILFGLMHGALFNEAWGSALGWFMAGMMSIKLYCSLRRGPKDRT